MACLLTCRASNTAFDSKTGGNHLIEQAIEQRIHNTVVVHTSDDVSFSGVCGAGPLSVTSMTVAPGQSFPATRPSCCPARVRK